MTQKCFLYIKTFGSLSGVKLLFLLSPHLNVHCTSLEKPYYAENIAYFKHDVHSQNFSIVANLITKICRFEMNSTCVLTHQTQQCSKTCFRHTCLRSFDDTLFTAYELKRHCWSHYTYSHQWVFSFIRCVIRSVKLQLLRMITTTTTTMRLALVVFVTRLTTTVTLHDGMAPVSYHLYTTTNCRLCRAVRQGQGLTFPTVRLK